MAIVELRGGRAIEADEPDVGVGMEKRTKVVGDGSVSTHSNLRSPGSIDI
jgi:hypothetical protein